MRTLFLLLLLWCARYSYAQSLTETLRQDFAKSRRPLSVHESWYASDTVNINARDTISFHNKPSYFFDAKGVCRFLTWTFTSGSTISQSAYFHCVGQGYSTMTLNGSGVYRFKLKEAAGHTYLKLIDHKFQVSWFAVSRSVDYDAQNAAYPVMTLVRLKHKPF